MDYKVCILAAGEGKRMLPLTKNFNKALLPISFKAAISHIIEKFPKEIEIVVAIGYEKEKIIQYLLCAHSDRKIQFVEIDNISGTGSGPGYSLLCCKNYLKVPFIFSSVDTIVQEDIPIPDHNWMGISPVKKSEEYCTVSVIDSLIVRLDDKIKSNNKEAFIGLAGIKDYNFFFDYLEEDHSLIQNEKQVSNGFRSLIKKKLHPKTFTWHDIGKIDGYNIAKEKLSKQKELFNFEKKDEYIYFVGNKVIKFFQDKKIVHKRCLRAKELNGLCPSIENETNFFYSYARIEGTTIYNLEKSSVVKTLLQWLNKNLWKRKYLDDKKMSFFEDSCRSFYFTKTIDRLSTYQSKYKLNNSNKSINGEQVDTVSKLISKIDFNWLCKGIPTKFHGDLQFDNILLTNNGDFALLDWRQDFSGILEYGDMYYDLAKLNGGIYVSYQKIKQNLFTYEENLDDIKISVHSDFFLKQSKKIFDNYVKKNNLDIRKIEILTGIIFLNMSPMHHAPFNHFIYHLGRQQIHKWINLE